MLLQEDIIKGIRKPCNHEFDKFQMYKWEVKARRQSSNDFIKDMSNYLSGKSKYFTTKRWIADCPVCGKLWLVDNNKKILISNILKMNKSYLEMDIENSIRQGKNMESIGE